MKLIIRITVKILIDLPNQELEGKSLPNGLGKENGNIVYMGIDKTYIFAVWISFLIILVIFCILYIAGWNKFILGNTIDILGYFKGVLFTSPIILVVGFIFNGASRLLFSKSPVVLINETEISLPSVGLTINLNEVSSFSDESFLLKKGTMLKMEFKTSDRRRLKAYLLFPAVFATSRSYMFCFLVMSGGVAGNHQKLIDHLQKYGMSRT